MSEVPITFQPSGRVVYVLPGTLALEAAAQAGLAVQTPCGGRGTCGKCRVRFIGSSPEPVEVDGKTLSPEQLADGWRLACQHTLTEPARLFVPPESVYGTAEQILTGDKHVNIEIDPAVRRQTIRLAPPTMEDPRDDLARLRDAIGKPVDIATPLLRHLPRLLRQNNWTVTVTLADGRIIDIGPGDACPAPLGAAFDIGTTTVVGTLMDLSTGREVAVAARINPQTAFGDDVISRILVTREQPDGLERLHRSITQAISEMLGELAVDAGIATTEICEVTIAGNTTMQLLLAGVWPGPLGEIPFAAGFCDGLTLDAADLSLPIHPRGRVYILPSIGGFLGGDTVAGVLATDLEELAGNSLLIDIGTNGEIVLARDGKLWAASTAAGPAFEGARISMGMRATAGAIEKVILDGEVRINVIGDKPAVGLCGTALIDAAAGLLNAGLIDSTGRMLGDDELPANLPPAIAARVRGAGSAVKFLLTEGDAGRAPVALTQRDIRELQLASGAIRAGVSILLERAGVRADQLDAVFLAGAFGNYIRRENARRIGLLPDVPIERIHFVGNAASMGAKLTLMSASARVEAGAVARSIQRVDLSADLEFQMKFADAMIFPE
ncbi:MAG: ASKHA domain-containing protein [Phycisphaerae bacterium]|nr:ASKHA domain-containing protein [Phycisphaerae bacterium]